MLGMNVITYNKMTYIVFLDKSNELIHTSHALYCHLVLEICDEKFRQLYIVLKIIIKKKIPSGKRAARVQYKSTRHT